MKQIIWLSGEHPSLPLAELKGASHAENVRITEVFSRIAVIEGKNAPYVFQRMGYARKSSDFIAEGNMDEVIESIKRFELPDGSFAVRAWKYGDFEGNRRDVERKIGGILAKERKIDLEKPDNILSLYLGEKIFAGMEVKDKRNLSEREPTKRPFFSPVTLSPKMARALINLSRAERGKELLDPFCGTGAVLLEASIIGIKAIGSDFDERMIKGAEINLKHYGAKAELHVRDISEISSIKVQHIATDPPYGRSSTTGREAVEKLYKRAFKAMAESMDSGYLAMILPDMRHSSMAEEEGFSLIEHHEVRVHRSLTRHFCVFRRD